MTPRAGYCGIHTAVLFSAGSVRRQPVEAWLPRLAAEHGWDPSLCEACKSENGAPYLLVGGNRFFCSVAHAIGVTAIAVHPNAPIGVDVEPISLDRTDSDLLRHYFPEADATPGEKSPDNDHFLKYWTAAEAWLKAKARGIVDLEAAAAQITASDCRLSTWREERDGRHWRLSEVVLATRPE